MVTSCLPPVSAISRGFLRRLRSLPAFTLGYDFDTIRALLLEYVQDNFPDWKDFLESTTGMMYLELMAYVTTMLAYRSDFQRAQAYLDTVTDIDTLSRLMLLVGERLKSPSPASLTQMDAVSGTVNIRATRTTAPESGNVSVYSGTGFFVPTELGAVRYEIFELDNNLNPKYADVLSQTRKSFILINNNRSSSDPPQGKTVPEAPSSQFTIVEGTSIVESFISTGDPDQVFELTRFPLITDYAHNEYRAAVQIQSANSSFRDTGWEEVDTLIDSTSDDKHFEVEWDGSFRGKIKFGNGIFGQIPAPGSTIWVTYRVGGGASKRIGTEKLNLAVDAFDSSGSMQVRLNNFAPTLGGGNGDDLNRAKALLPSRIRRQDRIVSGEDFASFAADFPGIAKAKAELLNNDATGNLVRLRIMEYTGTSEGYLRPYEGTAVTLLSNNLISNIVASSSYDSVTNKTTVRLVSRLGQDFISEYGDEAARPYLISRLGTTKEFTIPVLSAGTRIIEIADEDATDLFPAGASVGLANMGSYTLRLPTSAGTAFDIEGPGITRFGTTAWPGDRTQWGVVQINNEFLQFQKEPAGSPSTQLSFVNENKYTIVSRGYYGTQVTSHPLNSRVYQEGIRPDLYRAINLIKVEPSELLLLAGKILPFYMLLTVRTTTSSDVALFENIRLQLEDHFNFTHPRWGFGEELRISQILNIIQEIPGVDSAVFRHATQETINNTDSTQSNYTTTQVDKDITNVPSDTCLGMLQWKEAIGQPNAVISTEPAKTYFLDVGSDMGATNSISSIRLSTSSGSDLSFLPQSGLLKIKGEIFAYKERIGGLLKGITRNIYDTGSANDPVSYLAIERNPIYMAPNILINIVGAN